METTINARILLLKSQSDLTNLDWCREAGISHGTLHNIQKGENVQQKTINTLCESLNLNKTWLLTGEGPQYKETPKAVAGGEITYRDAYIDDLKNQVNYLQEMLRMALGGKQKSFRNPLQNTDSNGTAHIIPIEFARDAA